MAKLFNAFGFSHERWLRHLKLPECQTKPVVKGQVYAVPPNSDTDSETEVMLSMKTRAHPRNPDLVCAIKRSGACSKSFSSPKELAKWVTEYGNEWRIHFMTNTKAPSKRKSTSANSSPKRSKSYVVSAFKDAFNDLSAHYNHDAVTIGDEEYLLFNVPADHQCLFHSIAADIRSLLIFFSC